MIFNYKANTNTNKCDILDANNTILGVATMRNISNNTNGVKNIAWQVYVQAIIPEYPNKTFKVTPDTLEGSIDTDAIKTRNTTTKTTNKTNILEDAKTYLTEEECKTFTELYNKITTQKDIEHKMLAFEQQRLELVMLGRIPKQEGDDEKIKAIQEAEEAKKAKAEEAKQVEAKDAETK